MFSDSEVNYSIAHVVNMLQVQHDYNFKHAVIFLLFKKIYFILKNIIFFLNLRKPHPSKNALY